MTSVALTRSEMSTHRHPQLRIWLCRSGAGAEAVPPCLTLALPYISCRRSDSGAEAGILCLHVWHWPRHTIPVGVSTLEGGLVASTADLLWRSTWMDGLWNLFQEEGPSLRWRCRWEGCGIAGRQGLSTLLSNARRSRRGQFRYHHKGPHLVSCFWGVRVWYDLWWWSLKYIQGSILGSSIYKERKYLAPGHCEAQNPPGAKWRKIQVSWRIYRVKKSLDLWGYTKDNQLMMENLVEVCCVVQGAVEWWCVPC